MCKEFRCDARRNAPFRVVQENLAGICARHEEFVKFYVEMLQSKLSLLQACHSKSCSHGWYVIQGSGGYLHVIGVVHSRNPFSGQKSRTQGDTFVSSSSDVPGLWVINIVHLLHRQASCYILSVSPCRICHLTFSAKLKPRGCFRMPLDMANVGLTAPSNLWHPSCVGWSGHHR